MPEGRVFVSYRREDTRHPAGRLADRLADRLGRDRVFMDVDSVEPGADFAEAIEHAVAQCDVLLALIGSLWTEITDARGRRRLDDPDDYVVLEIGTALARGIRVVPVLVDDARMPSRDELPPALVSLTRRQAVRLEHESFGAGAAQLLTVVEARLRQAAADSPSPAPARRVFEEVDAPVVGGNLTQRQADVVRGVRIVDEDLRRMLGPGGADVPVRDERGRWLEATDSYMYAVHHRPEDPRDELGAQYLTELVRGVHDGVGDGGAVAAVLAHDLVERAAEELRDGAHPTPLARGLRAGLEAALAAVRAEARFVETKEQLTAYAAGVAQDQVAGEVIAEAFDKVGASGVVVVETAPVRGIELRLDEGMRLPAGYLSPHFVTDAERGEAVLDNPYVLVSGTTISAVGDVLPLLEKVLQSGRPLLVLARGVEGEALSTLVVNRIQGTLRSVAVKVPGYGNAAKADLQDVAVLTGATVVSPEVGLTLRDATLDLLGRAGRVIATADTVTVAGGEGDAEQIAARVNQIRREIEIADSDFDRERLQERLSRLAGGIGTIILPEADEADDRRRLDRYRRAVQAVYATIRAGGGLLPGGCTSLARAVDAVRPVTRQPGMAGGAQLIADVLRGPYVQILANAGVDVPTAGVRDVGGVVEVDASTGRRADLLAAGIFDSSAVLRAALEGSVGTAERFLRTP